MLDHASIAIPDPTRAARFQDAVMAAFGDAPRNGREASEASGLHGRQRDDAGGYLTIRMETGGPGAAEGARHRAFRTPGHGAANAFHAACVAAHGRDDGPPGLRPRDHAGQHAATLRTSGDNRAEAVCSRGAAEGAG